MRPSAASRNSSSSGVPTEMRIAVGAPKPPSGRTITPSSSSRSKNCGASSPISTNTKFATAPGAGSSPCFPRILVSSSRPRRFASRRLVTSTAVVEARERRDLRGGRDVEGPPHLGHRLAHVEGADRVPDPEPGEAVDLRERPQHDDAAPPAEMLGDRVGVVGILDVLEVGLVDHREDVLGDPLEERVQLRAAVRRPGRVVREADVDDLRPRTDRVRERVEVVAVVAERHPRRGRALLGGVDHVARERRPAADDLVARGRARPGSACRGSRRHRSRRRSPRARRRGGPRERGGGGRRLRRGSG